jgi:hypothetical protein
MSGSALTYFGSTLPRAKNASALTMESRYQTMVSLKINTIPNIPQLM